MARGRDDLVKELERRARLVEKIAPLAKSLNARRAAAVAQREREAQAKTQELLDYAKQFAGVKVGQGHEIAVAVVSCCLPLNVGNGPEWVQVGVDYWGTHRGAVPHAVPMAIFGWSGHDYESVDLLGRKGYAKFEEVADAIFLAAARLDETYIKAAIDRAKALRW